MRPRAGHRQGTDLAVLVTIAHFHDYAEAQIAKAKLEQAGLVVFLGEIAHMSTVPILAIALDGVRLQVLDVEADDARALLSETFSSAAFVVDQCPACGSDDVFRPQSLWLNLVALLFGVIGAPKSGARSCRNCRHRW